MALLTGLLLGAVLGLLGGGGALVTIPVLLYIFDFPLRTAIASSLLLVMLGALPALSLYAWKRQVKIIPAIVLGGSGVLGAALGSRFSGLFPPMLLYILLLVMMGISAMLMIRSSGPLQFKKHIPAFLLVLPGLFIGMLTGLLGVGGGFLIVPALYLLSKMEPRETIATSLVIIAVNAASGVIGYWKILPIDHPVQQMLAFGVIAGSFLGFWLSFRISQKRLKQAFGYLLLVLMGVLIGFPPL